jgi:tripartite ATP-independent transporter DctP family solute receptor
MPALTRRRYLGSSLAAGAAAVLRSGIVRAATRQFRLGHDGAPGSCLASGTEAFAKAVAERSEGRLKIAVFGNSELGTESEMLGAVASGFLDVTTCPIGVTSDYSRETILIELPFLFRDPAQARAACDGPLGRHCADLLRLKGIDVLAFGEIGVRHMTANKPIRTPADLKGLRLRVPQSEPILVTFKALGADAAPLPLKDVPEALRTGRIDAEENPINIIVSSHLNTVQSHLSLTGHAYTPYLFAFSAEIMEEVSAADRQLLIDCAALGGKASRDLADSLETSALRTLEAAGMTIIRDSDHEAFQAAAEAAGDTLAHAFGGDSIRHIRSLIA